MSVCLRGKLDSMKSSLNSHRKACLIIEVPKTVLLDLPNCAGERKKETDELQVSVKDEYCTVV